MSEPSSAWPTLTIAVGLIAWVVAVRFRRGSVLGPFPLSLLMLVAIFGVRPVLMIHYDTYDIYGLDVISGFNQTARLGFVAVTTLTAGYWISRLLDKNRHQAPSEPATGGRMPPTVRVAAITCVACSAAWFVVMALIGGGPAAIGVLYAGRSAAATSILGNTPSAVFCLPIAGAVLLAAARIRTERSRHLTVRERVYFWAAIAASTIPSAALGGRRFLVPCVLAALVATAVPRWRAPVTVRMVAFASGSLLLLAAIPFVRSSGARTEGAGFLTALQDYFGEAGINGTLRSLFLSYDTDAFGYMSYVVPRLGDGVPYGYGRSTIGDLFLNALPVSSGVQLWSDQLLTQFFGAGCAGDVCPVASAVGILYFDWGLPVLIAGCLLLGFWFGRFDGALLRAGSYRLLALLTVGGFAMIAVRGSSMSTAWLAVNVLLLAAVLLRVLGTAEPHDVPAVPLGRHVPAGADPRR